MVAQRDDGVSTIKREVVESYLGGVARDLERWRRIFDPGGA
jgi:hypothetical protein